MSVATELLETFSNRLRQVHISDVNSSSKHERLNRGAIHAFGKVANLIPESTPILLETPVTPAQIGSEIAAVQLALPCDVLVQN